MRLIILVVACMLCACAGSYETALSEKQEWQELGAYHGEQGYRQLAPKRLADFGAATETDYERYRAGYLKGRSDYCNQSRRIQTVVNPDFPDECGRGQRQFGLVERGY